MNRIKELRNSCGLTQKKLAEQLGLSPQVVGYYENEVNQPSPDMLIRLANFFECSIDYLLGREDDFGNVVVPGELTAPKLSDEERELLDTYRALSLKNKMHVSMYAQIRLEEQESDTRRRG